MLTDTLSHPAPGPLGSTDGADLRGRQAKIEAPTIRSLPAGDIPESHPLHDAQVRTALGSDDGAHGRSDAQCAISPVVAEIIQLWRLRQRWHRAEKSLILQAKAVCRAWTGGDKEAANRLYAGLADVADADPILLMALLPFEEAIAQFATQRNRIEKRLRALAMALPLWPWVRAVKGFGNLNLAALIGEAGAIAAYRSPSALWKRMGLAVIDGRRQRRVADADEALRQGYAPRRRTVAYLLGDTLIKAGESCPYRPVYAARRTHTAKTHPDWSKAHSHNDAARVMVKRVLRDLWREARRLEGFEEPKLDHADGAQP